MDRKPFAPADGVTPRWQKLYSAVLTKEVGDEITYREAAEIVGFDKGLGSFPTRKIVQQAMRTAVAHLENNGERTVSTVTNFGWVVLDASRELRQVDRRLTKTRRAAGRTVRGGKALNGRREELSQFERERLDWVSRAAQVASQVSGRRRVSATDLRKMIETGGAAAD